MWTAILTLSLAGAAAGDTELHWRDGRHALDALPAELPAPAAEALAVWGPWASEHELDLYLDEPGRVLFVAHDPERRALELVGRTTAFFDRHLPAPDRAPGAAPGTVPGADPAASGGGVATGSGIEGIPEDPESGGLGTSLDDALSGGAPAPATRWGASGAGLDRDTIVILALEVDHYGPLIDHLVERNPSLAGWGQAARASAGFVLESPPVGAWVDDAVVQEEWDADGELVHRLTDLLLLRRFGRQPYWIAQGIAWTAEMELRKGIWCYPFRDEFVYTVEHSGWPTDVRNRVKKEFKKESLKIGHLSGLKRGGWNGEAARMAFASMSWMLEQHPEALARVLEDLRLVYEQESRVDLGGGAWERATGYEVPPEVVGQLLYQHVGDDVFDQLTAALKNFR